MRILLHSFLAGLGAIALVSVLGYFIRPGGDTHLGPFIYVVLAVVYFVCHIFGTVVANLCAQRLDAIGSRSFLALSVSFLAISASNVGAFVLINKVVIGCWVWEASFAWLVSSLVVGVVAASVFVFGSKFRPA